MELTSKIKSNDKTPTVHPKQFNLWLAVIGISMFFAGLTSAYIVRRAEGNWEVFALPQQFIYSTVLVILSSITLQWAWFAAKNDELNQVKAGILSTILLGLGFGISQYLGWKAMVQNELFFSSDSVSVSFVYAISALHALHVLGGLVGLCMAFFKATKLQIHKKNMISINLNTTYWHFMGLLWIYLYLFLFLNR